ncbi:MAG: cell envelope integrity protein TolA [Planctomycetota bacterium]|nr:MAG: cell envelope integrity protein TolA [Planctomycetota bacterium]
MNEGQEKPSNLLDTTDCLEAVGVFRGWKNFLFIIIIVCLVLLQISFWLVNLGYVKVEEGKEEVSTAAVKEAEQIEPAGEAKGEIEKAAKQVAGEANEPAEAAPQQAERQERAPDFSIITFGRLAGLIRFFDFVLILAAALYCLTMLFGLKVSLLGRLGGINHISRAFFLSLLGLVLLLPWQRFFAGVVAGAIYTPGELLRWYTIETTGGIFGIIVYYLRFSGYWLIVLLFVIFAQIRSVRWAKAILRRLEVI